VVHGVRCGKTKVKTQAELMPFTALLGCVLLAVRNAGHWM